MLRSGRLEKNAPRGRPVRFLMHVGKAWAAIAVIQSLCSATLAAHLSHEGLYVNLPHQFPLLLYVDRTQEALEEATITVTSTMQRTLPEVQACSWHGHSSIEACEQLDLHLKWTNTSYTVSDKEVHPDGGIVVPGDPLEILRHSSASTVLRSVVIEWSARNLSGKLHHQRWWVGHVSMPEEQRARWPVGPGEYVTRGGVPNRAPVKPWDGRDMPRISGGTYSRLRQSCPTRS